MRLGLYTFASLALIGLMSAFAYTINPDNYAVELAGINLNFPVALWIAIPMLILLIATIFHMAYHGTKSYFARRKWSRDANELQDAIYWSLLKEPKEHSFSIPQIKSGAALLSVSSIEVLDSTEGLSDKLGKTITWVKKIQNGEYIDLKEKKVAKFMSAKNPLVVQNELNRLKDNSEFAESILMSKDSHADEVVSSALSLMINKESLFKVRKFSKQLSGTDFAVMLDRVDADEDIGFTIDNIESFCENIDMKCQDYMRLARSTIKKLTPDENLALFKKFATDKDVAQNAYLYLLFQYEMLDAVKGYLEESDESEFRSFRALYTLKKGKYNYRVSDIISSSTVCNEG